MRNKTWILRAECALILETTYANVRRMQRQGELGWRKDPRGRVVSDRAEVEALARKRLGRGKSSGDLAAHVYQLIREGKSLVNIVIETKADPAFVEHLFHKYSESFGPVDGGGAPAAMSLPQNDAPPPGTRSLSLAALLQEARVVLDVVVETGGEGQFNPESPAEACAWGALRMFSYMADRSRLLSFDEQLTRTASILGMFSRSARAAARREASSG